MINYSDKNSHKGKDLTTIYNIVIKEFGFK